MPPTQQVMPPTQQVMPPTQQVMRIGLVGRVDGATGCGWRASSHFKYFRFEISNGDLAGRGKSSRSGELAAL
jgi:hypothetical protein